MMRQNRRTFLATAVGAAALGFRPARAQAQSVTPQDLTTLTLKQASDLVRRKTVSPVDLTMACLARIEKYNSTLNAYITVDREGALARAREMEAEIRAGRWRGPLHG